MFWKLSNTHKQHPRLLDRLPNHYVACIRYWVYVPLFKIRHNFNFVFQRSNHLLFKLLHIFSIIFIYLLHLKDMLSTWVVIFLAIVHSFDFVFQRCHLLEILADSSVLALFRHSFSVLQIEFWFQSVSFPFFNDWHPWCRIGSSGVNAFNVFARVGQCWHQILGVDVILSYK